MNKVFTNDEIKQAATAAYAKIAEAMAKRDTLGANSHQTASIQQTIANVADVLKYLYSDKRAVKNALGISAYEGNPAAVIVHEQKKLERNIDKMPDEQLSLEQKRLKKVEVFLAIAALAETLGIAQEVQKSYTHTTDQSNLLVGGTTDWRRA